MTFGGSGRSTCIHWEWKQVVETYSTWELYLSICVSEWEYGRWRFCGRVRQWSKYPKEWVGMVRKSLRVFGVLAISVG